MSSVAARRRSALAGVALLAAGCGSSSSPGPTIAAPSGPPPSGVSLTASPLPEGAARSLTYHGDDARTGNAASEPALGTPSVAWRSPQLDGLVYAQPLVAGDLVVVATEGGSVYGLLADSGDVRWRRHLADPIAQNELPCGNIDPLGITGTPVIDSATRTVFAAAETAGGAHLLSALDLGSGAQRWQRAIDPPGSVPLAQQQRAALSLAGGTVYVPFGGLFGDCGAYHGWVVGVSVDGSGPLLTYQVPSQREAGIWAVSGAAIDGSGDLYVATGNGASGGDFDHGNAVVRLSPQLAEQDFFAPTNWRELNAGDTDLGSTGPTLIGASRLIIAGKEGRAYLLRRDHLGGIGGQVTSVAVCGEGAFGGIAWAAPFAYLPCAGGLQAVRVGDDGSLNLAWRATSPGSATLAGGVLWTMDTASGTLYALDPVSGAARWSTRLGPTPRFTTPAAAGGRVYVAVASTVVAIGGV